MSRQKHSVKISFGSVGVDYDADHGANPAQCATIRIACGDESLTLRGEQAGELMRCFEALVNLKRGKV
jgi:hypothetical protein